MRKGRTITPTEMRVINRSAILDLIRRESPISRSAIAERLEVSLPTVMRIVEGLIAEQLVRALAETESSGGRRRALVAFNASHQVMIGADLGGEELYAAAADLTGAVLCERTQPLGAARGEAACEKLTGLIESLLEEAGAAGHRVRGLGVGAPGRVDYHTGVVLQAPALRWNNFPLRQRLEEKFGLPVIVDNDASLAALGEVWFGGEPAAESLVLVCGGPGLPRAGIVLDGAIYRGAYQAAGEIHHLGDGNDLAALAGVIRALTVCFDPQAIVLGGALPQEAAFAPFIALVQAALPGVRLPQIRISRLGRQAVVMGAITNVLHHTANFTTLHSMG